MLLRRRAPEVPARTGLVNFLSTKRAGLASLLIHALFPGLFTIDTLGQPIAQRVIGVGDRRPLFIDDLHKTVAFVIWRIAATPDKAAPWLVVDRYPVAAPCRGPQWLWVHLWPH